MNSIYIYFIIFKTTLVNCKFSNKYLSSLVFESSKNTKCLKRIIKDFISVLLNLISIDFSPYFDQYVFHVWAQFEVCVEPLRLIFGWPKLTFKSEDFDIVKARKL